MKPTKAISKWRKKSYVTSYDDESILSVQWVTNYPDIISGILQKGDENHG